MQDYSKLTVANLRAVLKERNIPSTGLTRKQQIIDRLEQADREAAAQSDAQNAPAQDGGAADNPQTLESEAAEKATETPTPAEAPAAEAAQDNGELRDAQPELPAPLESQTTTLPTEEPLAPVTAESSVTIVAEETQQTAPSSSTQQSATQTPIPTSESQSQAPSAAPPSQTLDAPPLSGVSSIDSLKTSELEEDRRKRKRRSLSPPVISSEVANKKLRQDDDTGIVHLKEDSQQQDARMEEDAKSQAEQPQESQKLPEAETEEVMDDAKMVEQDSAQARKTTDDQQEHALKAPSTKGPERDGRYNDLFQGAAASSSRPLRETPEVEARSVEPSIHPATTALYIRNFMRPLHPGQLKSHLISLATAPSSPPDDSILQTFHLNQIRTHAYARFTSTSPAARVRSALHGRKWPAERDRKELWVDFVPEEKVEEWIETEQENGGGRNKRWEVVYEATPKGGVEAFLREADSDSMSGPSRPREMGRVPPNGTPLRSPGLRRPAETERLAPSAPEQPEGAGKSFVALDKLFQSTTTKPKLYFQPVSADIANKRLDELDRLTSRDWRGGRGFEGGEELRRYTFEDRSVLVDGGLHYTGPRARGRERDAGGYRSPRGGGGGYGRRGGYRAR